MSNKDKTLALIGAGQWGQNLVRNFYELDCLHTICDPDLERLHAYKKTYKDVQLVSSIDAVLEEKNILQVAIAAPALRHYDLAKRALLAGKDVYVEKPLCLDTREGEELIELAKKNKKILMVGHILQYHPCVTHIKELVKSGSLGKVQYIVSNRLNLGKIRLEENALWNFAPHDISVILSLCGDKLPDVVRCVGGSYLSKGIADTTMTTLRFSGGTRAHIYVSWLNPFKEQKLTIVGSHGMLVFDDTKKWEEKLIYYEDYVNWVDGYFPVVEKKEGKLIHVPYKEPLKQECRHFLEACEKRSSPRTDGKEGLLVLQVLQAAQASLNEDGEQKDPREKHPVSLTLPKYFAHSTAIVEADAFVGEDSKIWHFSHIMSGAVLGKKCNIGQNVVISPGVSLGENVKVQNNVSIYSGVNIEDHAFIGPSAVFTNIKNPRSQVIRRDEYLETHVGRGASVGANATIVCGLNLGAYCFIAAGSVVTKDVKPYALMMGNPARQTGWMSRFGERLDIPLSVEKDEELQVHCEGGKEAYLLKGDYLHYLGEKKPEKELSLLSSCP